MNSFWTIGCVMAGKEFKFRDMALEIDSSLEIYVPVRKTERWIRHTRKFKIVKMPAFARYVFVRLTDPPTQEHNLRACRVKVNFIRSEGFGVCVLRDGEIDRLRKMEDAGELDSLPPEIEIKFEKGTVHFIKTGPLKGLYATVIRQPKKNAKEVQTKISRSVVTLPLAFFTDPE